MTSPRSYSATLPYPDDPMFRLHLLQWAWEQEYMVALENNGMDFPYGPFPSMVAAGACARFDFAGNDDLSRLGTIHEQSGDWLFGHISYDIKNQLENLVSQGEDPVEFPDIHFFQPAHLLILRTEGIQIESTIPPAQLMEEILSTMLPGPGTVSPSLPRADKDRSDYITTVEHLKQHILDGDIYEINFCLRYQFVNHSTSPVWLYQQLTTRSPTPFATLYRIRDHYLISASPERFLKKEHDLLISQPIKGTVRRSSNPEQDEVLRTSLLNNEKERAENLMIVDLVRNDLARSCTPGTVRVKELFGLYSFTHLHQMISTVCGKMERPEEVAQAIANAFPMGSMTGAPKIKVMELIDRYEGFKRGIYSGTVGFIDPCGNFDLNVVIRSIYGNLASQRGAFAVGSAITADSDPDLEYKECMLKARAILEVLNNS